MATETPTVKLSPSRPQPLRIVRRNALLSQRTLAERAQVTPTTISRIENGSCVPQLSVMRLICDALGVSHFDVEEFAAAMAGRER